MLWGVFPSHVSVFGVVMQGSRPLTIPGSIHRLNYGTIFKSEKNVILTNEYWRQTYEIVLPKLPPRSNFKYDCITLPSKACISFTKFMHQIENLDSKTMIEFQNIYKFVDDNVPFIPVSNRKKKSLLPFVGDLSKSLFGTATMEDVNILKQHVNSLIKNNLQVTKFIKMQSHQLSSYMTAAENRFDNIQESVKENFLVITNLSRIITTEIQNFQSGLLQLSELYNSHLETAHTLVKQYSSFKQSISTLIDGKLSPELISASVIKNTIQEISKILSEEYSNFYLTIKDPEYYYTHGHFAFGRHFGAIYVTLKFPLSHEKLPLNLYQVISMPIPVNGTSNHATQLLDLPHYLAITSHQQYYLLLDKTDLATCNKHQLYLCNFNKALKPVTQKSCIMSLFANDKQSVNALCNFRFLQDLLEPTAIELAEGSTLVYNSYNLIIDCPNNKTILHGCSMCVIQLPCRCSITTKHWYLPPRLVKCQTHSKVQLFHPVNLALLQQFFNDSKLIALQADTTFASSLTVQIPGFELYKHEFQKRLVADSKIHFNMKKMAEATKRNEKIFQSLSEPLLNGDLDMISNWPTTNDILTYISFIITIIVSLVCGLLFMRQRKLLLVISILKQTAYTKGIDADYIFRKSTPENPRPILDVINDTLKWDHVIFALSILILITCVIILINKSRRSHCGTTIILELTSGTTCAIIPLLSFSLCPSLLEINPPTSISKMYVKDWTSRILITDWTNFKVTNKLQYSTIEIPPCTKLSWMNCYRVKQVMKQPYMAYILLKHGTITMPIPSLSIQKHLEYFKD